MTALLGTPLPALVERATGFQLSPMQHALLAIGTGKRPQDLRGDVQRAAVQALGFNRCQHPARVLFINAGARSGKTMISAYLATQRALVCDLSGMAPGEQARVAFLSASMRQARAGLKYARGLIRALGLDRIVTSERREAFTITRDGREIEFSLVRGNAGGDPLAGAWFPALVVHEAGIAVDPSSGGQPLDLDAVEKAVRPRLLPARGTAPGGLLIEETTSRDAAGPAYDRVNEHHGKPDAPITVFRASTHELRPDDRDLHREIERERAIDPINAAREYDGEWLTAGSGTSYVFAVDVLDPIALDRMDLNQPPVPHLESWAGVDLGFSADGSALAIVRKRSPTDFHLAALRRWRPTRHAPLQPSVVINEVLNELERHGTRLVLADVHHFAQLAEAAGKRRNIRVAPAPPGAQGKHDAHTAALELFSGGHFKMGRDPQLLRNLQRIVATRTPDGAIKIRSPRSKSRGHGDDAAALVLAAYAAHHYGGHRRDPRFIPGAPSLGMQQLGIVDSHGNTIGPSTGAEFSINELTGRAEARPSRARSDWESSGGIFDRGAF